MTATATLARTHTQPDEAFGVEAILERLSSTYTALSVYMDRGVVSTIHPGELRRELRQTFTTRFERSKAFTWTSDLGRHDDYGVTFDGAHVVHFWNGKRETMDSVGDAIGRAAGVSELSSIWVPTLLMPEALRGGGLRDMARRATDASRLPDEVINGRPCFVVAFTDEGAHVRIWISKRDFLIRRIEQRYARYNSVTTTDYTPQTDISLAP